MPNKRLTTIIITTWAISVITMRAIRSFAGPMLHFPQFNDPTVWVESVITQFIAISVDTRRTFSYRVFNLNRRFVQRVRNGRKIRLISGATISARRTGRVKQDLQGVREMIPNVSLSGALSIYTRRVSLLFPTAIFMAQANGARAKFRRIPMMRNAFLMDVNGLFISRRGNNIVSHPIFVNVLRHSKNKDKKLIRESVSWLFVLVHVVVVERI